MKIIYRNLLLAIIFISILQSCSKETKYLPLLLKIDTIMLSNPDSAYNMLLTFRNIKLQNAEERALYALLLTQAKDKKNIPHNNDSLISIAINYYKNTAKEEKKNRSYFYLGRSLQENDNISEAIYAYLKALDEKSTNYKNQVLIYDNLAICYESQNFFHKALEAYQQSYLINKINKDSIGILYSLRGLANLYTLQKDTPKALDYYNQALSIIQQVNIPTLESAIYCDISRFFHEQGDYKTANKYISMAIQNSSTKQNTAVTLFWKGKILYGLNQYDSAYYYFKSASTSEDIYTQTACYQSLYELKKKQQLYNEAVFFNDKALVLYDSIQNSLRQEEINDIIKEHELAIADQKYKITHQKYTTIISLCFLTGILGITISFMYINNKNKKRRLKLQQDLMGTIADRNDLKEQFKHLTLTNENIQRKNDELQTNLIQLWKQTMTISTLLFQTSDSFKKIISIEKCKYIPNKQKKKEDVEFIRKEINSTYAQAIQNLQESFPNLTHEDTVYCILSYLKLSNSTIKICMQTESAPALTQRRYRIKKQLSQGIFDFIFSLTSEK